jgi:hypothetical protein
LLSLRRCSLPSSSPGLGAMYRVAMPTRTGDGDGRMVPEHVGEDVAAAVVEADPDGAMDAVALGDDDGVAVALIEALEVALAVALVLAAQPSVAMAPGGYGDDTTRRDDACGGFHSVGHAATINRAAHTTSGHQPHGRPRSALAAASM